MKDSYETYAAIVLSTMRSMRLWLDADEIHDVKVALWESNERFLDKHNAQDRELTKDEAAQLRGQLFLRARGAIIDVFRFKTWAVRSGSGSGSVVPNLKWAPQAPTKNNFFDQFIEPVDFEFLLDRKFHLIEMNNGDIVIEYLTGSNMKEIGQKRGLTEARISQIFKEIQANA